MNEDTTADALQLQKENERLRKELEMFRQLQQVSQMLFCSFAAADLLLLPYTC